MQFKNATEVRNNFQDVVDHVHYTTEPAIVTRRNKPWVMIVPLPDDDEAYEAALERFNKLLEKEKNNQ